MAIIWPLAACFAVLIFVFLLKSRKWIRTKLLLRHIVEPEPGSLFSGHMAVFADRSLVRERRMEWLKRNPKLYKYNVGFLFSMVNVVHPDTASVVLRSSFPKENYFYSFLKPWLGDGLLVSKGQKWARDRRLLTNCFHFDILRSYMEVYTDACSVMLQKWSEACAKGESVDVTESSTLLTLDIILRCAMSYESNCQLEDSSAGGGDDLPRRYVAAVVAMAAAIVKREINLLHHIDFVYFSLSAEGRQFSRDLKTSHDMSQCLIRERKAALQEAGGKSMEQCRDFLEVLLTVRDEAGNGLSDEEVREQVDTFLFRGHDTTASALQWVLYHLAQHPDLQDRCRAEVEDVVFASDLATSASISHDHLGRLRYLTQFIKESMRISSPVPFAARELPEDTVINGQLLPCGTKVELPFLDLHMAPDHWPEPMKFDPERFSPDQSQGRHPYAYVPFSAGPRNCIGQTLAMDELKTSVATVLMRFRLSLDPLWPEPKWSPSMVARADPNIKLCLAEV